MLKGVWGNVELMEAMLVLQNTGISDNSTMNI
jgi:hypothetical protein